MKFGLRLPTYLFPEGAATLDTLNAFARRADELGFDSLWVVDHYLVARPSYRVAFMDPLQVLAAVASSSGSMRLGTSVLQLPLRNPVLLAKELATLDWLTNGRVEFGVGNGWQQTEFDGIGVKLTERGRRTDEYLEIMTRLWTEGEVSFKGEYFQFEGVEIFPKPVQKPYPRISFGGGSTVKEVFADDRSFVKSERKLDRVFRRIGKYGVGWQATSVSDPELLAQDWDQIAAFAREYGRDPNEIERMQTSYVVLDPDVEVARRAYGRIVGKDFDEFLTKSSYLFGSGETIVEELHKRAELGIDRMILTPVDTDVSQLDRWATDVLEPFRKLPVASRA
jgi:alkanesulfonate monooxygenase